MRELEALEDPFINLKALDTLVLAHIRDKARSFRCKLFLYKRDASYKRHLQASLFSTLILELTKDQ